MESLYVLPLTVMLSGGLFMNRMTVSTVPKASIFCSTVQALASAAMSILPSAFSGQGTARQGSGPVPLSFRGPSARPPPMFWR